MNSVSQTGSAPANAPTTAHVAGQTWNLHSGVWLSVGNGKGFTLHTTPLGHNTASVLGTPEIRTLLQSGRSSQDAESLFPPEFSFCPTSGVPLQRTAMPAPNQLWVPPHGSAAMTTRAERVVRGLHQTPAPLRLANQAQRQAEADADLQLALPPPGDYEFFSLPAASLTHVLLAVEPNKGALYAQLPQQNHWINLEHAAGGLLAETRMPRADWRCEVARHGLVSRLFLPTEEGLACVTPDALGLCFDVQYLGGARAIGAPIQFGEHVWLPISDGGTVKFVSATAHGQAGPVITSNVATTTLGRVHAPLADGRTALWPCQHGQLTLRKLADGSYEPGFMPWPTGLQPAFEFGSPYLSRDGSLWQLCLNMHKDVYTYIQLASTNPEHQIVSLPRLCSGAYNFRFGTKFKSEPWLDPEHGDDGAAEHMLFPLLESTDTAAVVGLQLEATSGIAKVLHSTERMRAQLVIDDSSSHVPFHTFAVSEPWRMRLFVHAGALWAYHPRLNRIDGWLLQV